MNACRMMLLHLCLPKIGVSQWNGYSHIKSNKHDSFHSSRWKMFGIVAKSVHLCVCVCVLCVCQETTDFVSSLHKFRSRIRIFVCMWKFIPKSNCEDISQLNKSLPNFILASKCFRLFYVTFHKFDLSIHSRSSAIAFPMAQDNKIMTDADIIYT